MSSVFHVLKSIGYDFDYRKVKRFLKQVIVSNQIMTQANVENNLYLANPPSKFKRKPCVIIDHFSGFNVCSKCFILFYAHGTLLLSAIDL